MAQRATLRAAAANKRNFHYSEVFCSLEIENKLLHYWHRNLQQYNVPITTQINQNGITMEQNHHDDICIIKPLLRESKEVLSDSLEDRLRSKGRQISSSLSQLTKRKIVSLLKKKSMIDMKMHDIVINEILRTMANLR